jgi:hypothetical protein
MQESAGNVDLPGPLQAPASSQHMHDVLILRRYRVRLLEDSPQANVMYATALRCSAMRPILESGVGWPTCMR